MQAAKAHELLLNLLEDPVNFPNHLEVSVDSYAYFLTIRN
jgi:hypothetical protein